MSFITRNGSEPVSARLSVAGEVGLKRCIHPYDFSSSEEYSGNAEVHTGNVQVLSVSLTARICKVSVPFAIFDEN